MPRRKLETVKGAKLIVPKDGIIEDSNQQLVNELKNTIKNMQVTIDNLQFDNNVLNDKFSKLKIDFDNMTKEADKYSRLHFDLFNKHEDCKKRIKDLEYDKNWYDEANARLHDEQERNSESLKRLAYDLLQIVDEMDISDIIEKNEDGSITITLEEYREGKEESKPEPNIQLERDDEPVYNDEPEYEYEEDEEEYEDEE